MMDKKKSKNIIKYNKIKYVIILFLYFIVITFDLISQSHEINVINKKGDLLIESIGLILSKSDEINFTILDISKLKVIYNSDNKYAEFIFNNVFGKQVLNETGLYFVVRSQAKSPYISKTIRYDFKNDKLSILYSGEIVNTISDEYFANCEEGVDNITISIYKLIDKKLIYQKQIKNMPKKINDDDWYSMIFYDKKTGLYNIFIGVEENAVLCYYILNITDFNLKSVDPAKYGKILIKN